MNQKAQAGRAAFPRFFLALILLLTLIAFSPALKNGWVKWDDTKYIQENPAVQGLSALHIRSVFTQPFQGNYIPLTFFSFALERAIFGEKPRVFITTNILLHLLNVFLAFLLVYRLMSDRFIALVSALLFGLHPIHVESVAWIAERKDVLYAFFFFLSLICYLNYRRGGRIKWYLLSIACMLLSVMSKSMAVMLPFVLVAIDFAERRRLFSARALLEKIPFLIISAVFTWIGMASVQANVADISSYDLSLPERMAVAAYGLANYAYKLVLPFQLSAYYPYPFGPGEAPPAWMWALLLACMAAILSLFYFLRHQRMAVWCLLFFLINLFPALQLFPVGDAVMADRFAYVASLGFFMLSALYPGKWFSGRRKNSAFLALGAITILLAYLTHQRTRVWKDPKTLWTDVLRNYGSVSMAHNNLANAYFEEGKSDSARAHYQRALELDPNNRDAWYNLGAVYFQKKEYARATESFRKSTALNPSDAGAWMALGLSYNGLNQYSEAEKSFDAYIALDSSFAEAYVKRGAARHGMKNYRGALADYNRAIELLPSLADAWGKRGVLRIETGDTTGACADFNEARKLGMTEAEAAIKEFCQ
ncbi:MAG: tetratricopeptide repeat protein [Bacteroidota bacterium]